MLDIPDTVCREIRGMPSLSAAPQNPHRKEGVGGNPDYLEWAGRQDCFGCICKMKKQGRRVNLGIEISDIKISEVHHIEPGGWAIKCPDEWAIPLCRKCHFENVHGIGAGKQAFLKSIGLWELEGMQAYRKAARLYLALFCRTQTDSEYHERAVYYFKLLDDLLTRTNDPDARPA